jgi:hypothetical protein
MNMCLDSGIRANGLIKVTFDFDNIRFENGYYQIGVSFSDSEE